MEVSKRRLKWNKWISNEKEEEKINKINKINNYAGSQEITLRHRMIADILLNPI